MPVVVSCRRCIRLKHLGAVVILRLSVSILTKTLPFTVVFLGFDSPIPWLVCLAFFFTKGFIKPSLGNRVVYQFVSLFGSSSLGLGYSLVFSKALLKPAISSVSAAQMRERERRGERETGWRCS
ncbi:hypothetical protein AHAS_Ahas15G0138700 [Arachis hypogaea]